MRFLFGFICLLLLGVNGVEAQTAAASGVRGPEVAPNASSSAKPSPKQLTAPSQAQDKKAAASCHAAQAAQPMDSCTRPTCSGHYMEAVEFVECRYGYACPEIERDGSTFGPYDSGYNMESLCWSCGSLTCSDYLCSNP